MFLRYIYLSFLGLFLVTATGLSVSCTDAKTHTVADTPLLHLASREADAIFVVNKPATFFEKYINEHPIVKENPNMEWLTYFKDQKALKAFMPESFLLSICSLGKHDFGGVISFEYSSKRTILSFLERNNAQKFTYNQEEYYFITTPKGGFYVTLLDGFCVVTSHKLFLENRIRQFITEASAISPALIKAYRSLSFNTEVSLLVDNTSIDALKHFLGLKNIFPTSLWSSGWSGVDFTMNQNALLSEGVYQPKDSISDFSYIFKGVEALSNSIQQVVPSKIHSLSSYTYDDYAILKENISDYNNKSIEFKSTFLDEFLKNIDEVSTFENTSGRYVAFRTIDEDIELSKLSLGYSKYETYRSLEVYKLKNAIDFGKKLHPLLSNNQHYEYFVRNGEYLLFASSFKAIKAYIGIIKTKDFLINTHWFSNFYSHLSRQSNVFVLQNNKEALKQLSFTEESAAKKIKLSGFDYSAFQLISDDDFSHINSILFKVPYVASSSKFSLVNTLDLDTDMVAGPWIVTSHLTGKKEILAQDRENYLYQFSSSGKRLWKKQLDATILGDIIQVDRYKNKRLQLVFATQKSIYLLDRNGKDVADFPVRLKAPCTQPIAVFDYDNNRNYRLALVQDSIVTLLSINAKKIKGFSYENSANAPLLQPVKHIRVGTKDYLVVNNASLGVQFLNRKGENRITINTSKPVKSLNEWSWYKGAFSSITSEGILLQINEQGVLTQKKVKGAFSKVWWDSSSDFSVLKSNNVLDVNSNSISLNASNSYDLPLIHTVKSKKVVSITNSKNQEVWLFDAKANPLKGTPIYGRSQALITYLSDKKGYFIVVQGDKDAIFIYQY